MKQKPKKKTTKYLNYYEWLEKKKIDFVQQYCKRCGSYYPPGGECPKCNLIKLDSEED